MGERILKLEKAHFQKPTWVPLAKEEEVIYRFVGAQYSVRLVLIHELFSVYC
jgi:hypothetical protein